MLIAVLIPICVTHVMMDISIILIMMNVKLVTFMIAKLVLQLMSARVALQQLKLLMLTEIIVRNALIYIIHVVLALILKEIALIVHCMMKHLGWIMRELR